MTSHTKIAISVPSATLRSVETARRRLGRSRSSVVAEALEAWLRQRGNDERDRAYLAGYERVPEPDDGELAAAVVATWEGWDKGPDEPTTLRSGRSRTRTKGRR